MIEWTDEALEAAWNAMFEEPFDGSQAVMIGAALDAAVKAQFGPANVAIFGGYGTGRAEAVVQLAVKDSDLKLIRDLAKEGK